MPQEPEMNLLERIRLNRQRQEEARARFEAAFEAAKTLPLSKRWRLFENGGTSGERLRDLGYAFFETDRDYSLGRLEDGVVEVSSWCGTEDADSDGFGMEECYDWWLLDECLQPIPGVKGLHSYSRQDMRMHSVIQRWTTEREKAAAIVARRK